MKTPVLFVHSAGAQGSHEGSSDFVAYLRGALGAEYEVLYPRMPNPENPQYDAWKAQVAKELATLDGEVILVGHSLGGSILLKYLSEERCNAHIAGLFVAAAPYWGGKDWQGDEYTLQENFAAQLPHGLRIFFYQSRDDAVVPFDHMALYAEQLSQATIRAVDGRGHEFAEGLPELVEDIKST